MKQVLRQDLVDSDSGWLAGSLLVREERLLLIGVLGFEVEDEKFSLVAMHEVRVEAASLELRAACEVLLALQ